MNINDAFQLALKNYQIGDLQRAKYILEEVLKFESGNDDILYFLGHIAFQLGDYDTAIQSIKRALLFNPNNAEAYYNLGSAYHEKGLLDEAIKSYQKALQFNSHFADAYKDLGLALEEKGQYDAAIDCFKKAIELVPDFAEAYNNLGNALQGKGLIDEAITCYQKALRFSPNLAEAHWNMALISLLTGNFKQGWKEFEWRWELPGNCPRDFFQPLWDGSDIRGRTIVLHAEQGFGDTIQFIRYAPLVAQRGAKVIVECQKELKSLLRNTEGIHHVQSWGEQLPVFDLHCPLLSLPFIFNTTLESIPDHIPYISVDPELVSKWRNTIQHDHCQFKIGLVWDVNPEHKVTCRSCSIELFLPLNKFENVTFYSLLKKESGTPAGFPLQGVKFFDYTKELHDFSDTAALMENLDLVISVDTAVAHLAGALGKPVWVLLPFEPLFRWMLDRQDSPWYPTMRLFRQPSPMDWESVIAKITDELQKKISNNLQSCP